MGKRRPRGRAGLDKQIQAERNEREQLKRGRLIGVTIGDLAEIIKGTQIIAWHAIAIATHMRPSFHCAAERGERRARFT